MWTKYKGGEENERVDLGKSMKNSTEIFVVRYDSSFITVQFAHIQSISHYDILLKIVPGNVEVTLRWYRFISELFQLNSLRLEDK